MTKFDTDFTDHCVNDPAGPVALTLRQKLLSVEGADAVVFPPTYAGIGYNIDELSDGMKVATIDSVGAQANRMEPLFMAGTDGAPENRYAALVPQITITYGDKKWVSILKAGHRLGDALIRSSNLADEAKQAFVKFLDANDASLIAKLAPTSLVFGAWDSRDTYAKLPRIVQSVIRAWNVDELKRSAQYNPPVDYAELKVFSKAEHEQQASQLAQRGFVHVPATGEHGGIVVHGEIRRDVTVNLIALRRLRSEDGQAMRSYILGLAVAAATMPLNGFLRQGCLVTPDPDAPAIWTAVSRDGARQTIDLDEEVAFDFARRAAEDFGVSASRSFAFDNELAKTDAKRTKTDAKKKA